VKDCGHKVPGKARRAKKGCGCDRCEEARAARRKKRKVENMTAAQREAKNAGQRAENISVARREKRNARQRVGGMTAEQLRRHRRAGADRSRKRRRAAESVGRDCGNRSSSNTRRPRRGCKCARCVELRAERNADRRVGVISEEQREQRNAIPRAENISEEQRERRNARLRVENMTPAQLKKHRKASAERSRLYRERKARERGA
jgi:hypothetical protein